MSWRDNYNTGNGGSGKFENVVAPVGKTIARVFGVAFVGKVESEFKGETKIKNELIVGIELPEHLHIFNEEKGEQPLISYVYLNIPYADDSNGYYKQSKLFKWYDKITDGDPITAEQFNKMEWDMWFVDKTLQVSVSHSTKQDGSIKMDIAPTSKEVEQVDAINPVWYYNLVTDEKDYWVMPEFIRKKVDGEGQSRARTRKMIPKANIAIEPPERG